MGNPPLATHQSLNPSERVIEMVRSRLEKNWHYDPDFFIKHFPIDDDIRSRCSEHKKTLRYRNRWKGIPASPKSASQLYAPLKNLINSVLRASNLFENVRRTLDISKHPILPDLKFPIHPPLLLAGAGEHFVGSDTPRPMPEYELGISALEVRLDDHDEITARDRLAVHIQQVFAHQFNRRFAFGLVVSQHTLTVYMFDRSGAVSSPSLDYHADPDQFFAVVAGLGSLDDERLGLDTTISISGVLRGKIQTREKVGNGKLQDTEYTLVANLYYSSDLVGRGTNCFVGYEGPQRKKAEIKTMYVIKDAWATTEDLDGKETEAFLIGLARDRGVLKGIPQIRHSEQVRVKDRTGYIHVDSILNNRREHSGHHAKLERVHSRIIMTPYGKPLDQFTNRKELLLAYYDAIQAHRNLYDVAGILHRDIKPGNILINPQGEEGHRGVLVDFDHAIRTDDESPYSTKKKIGTYMFMSRNALEGEEPQSYFDDLESFYYVLLYITMMYSTPGCRKKVVPLPIRHWTEINANESKGGFFVNKLQKNVEPWFGAPFQNLLRRLHAIFSDILDDDLLAEEMGKDRSAIDPAKVYDAMLSSVDQAIKELGPDDSVVEDTVGISEPRLVSKHEGLPNNQTVDQVGRESEDLSLLFSWIKPLLKPLKRKENVFTLAALRSRRDGVNYGIRRRIVR